MMISAEKEYAHIGASAGAEDHDRDLVHELNKRLDGLWRYDQYLANADGKRDLQAFWRTLKEQDEANVGYLKTLLAEEIRRGCF